MVVCKIAVVLLMVVISSPVWVNSTGTEAAGDKMKTAIVLAGFGTTVPTAVQAILNIKDEVQKAYPKTNVRITFTSNIVRAIWRKRRSEAAKWLAQGVPQEILDVKNIIQVMGDLQEEGFRNIVVQPLHMFYMEQSQDLESYVTGLASIETVKKKWKPFDSVVLGRPALGRPGEQFDYHVDVFNAIKTLEKDMVLARQQGAVIIYMGHGNKHWSTDIYTVTQKQIREMYPEVVTYVSVVEGSPSMNEIRSQLKLSKTKKVILCPFMITAGDHVLNDMAGEEAESWKSILQRDGYQVETILDGLGSNDAFAQLFVSHIADAARAGNIEIQ